MPKGPPIDLLLDRLAECPPEFLDADAHVVALLFDAQLHMGGERPKPPAKKNAGKVHRQLLAVASWVLHDDWFRTGGSLIAQVAKLPANPDLRALSKHIDAEEVITDEDRREEMIRLLLEALDMAPEGETADQAAARLQSVSSVVRERLLAEAREREERARKLRDKMAADKAREASAKWGWE